ELLVGGYVLTDLRVVLAGMPGNYPQHRAGTAIEPLREGAAHDIGHFLATGDRFRPLGDVLHVQHGIEVGEVVGQVAVIAGGHEQHRHRFAITLRHAAEGVFGARAMLHHEYTDLVPGGHAAEGIGHVRAGSFLAHDDGADVHGGGRFDDGVERVGEDVLDALCLQDAGDRFWDQHGTTPG